MSWQRPDVERRLDAILRTVFGTGPGEIAPEQSFAEDLMAESLDYVDIGLHVSHAFGIQFDFAEAAEAIREAGASTIRVRDLIDHVVGRLNGGSAPATGRP